MKMTGKAFARELFGVNHKRLTQTVLIDLIVFWGLHMADPGVQMAPYMLYLMVSTFTAGVMWQTLTSENRAVQMRNLFMLPFDGRELVFSYVAVLGAHTLITKTATLLAVLLAVSAWNPVEILGSVLCAVNAILMTAAVCAYRQHRCAGSFWAAGLIAVILFWGNQIRLIPLLTVSGMAAAISLRFADRYCFYCPKGENTRTVKGHTRYSVRRYLFRYLKYHPNYLVNTVVMWGAACVLPLFFRQMGGLSAVPVGFAILSLNTPVCILLSCDPALEQAVRFLPGQKKSFCVPYCLFVFFCNITADVIFLCSWQIWNGGITVRLIVAAVFFALQSAVCSVLLEWFYPVRDWKTESDLWHHPRKYLVPVIMLLLATAVGTVPACLPVLTGLLAVELAVLYRKIANHSLMERFREK